MRHPESCLTAANTLTAQLKKQEIIFRNQYDINYAKLYNSAERLDFKKVEAN